MNYYSTNHKANPVSFREAVFKGLPEDNGLYMPEQIPQLPSSFFDDADQWPLFKIGFEVLRPFVDGEIPDKDLIKILEDTLAFEIPLVPVTDSIFSLELFHGPTFAFKDIGARFLARCLNYFGAESHKKHTVLVATSGDTGSAVAQGFYKIPNVEVVLLYPSGKVSQFQEQQMASLGENIIALEVSGTFDDCQKLVKQAFLDEELQQQKNLTSANSINIARLLPQIIYYFYGFFQLPIHLRQKVTFSVPSGNYGNLTAGLIAQKLGLPVKHFLACSNVNNIVPEYLKTSEYFPKPGIPTISNAMDVGDPSNFARMLELFSDSHSKMSSGITGFSYSDEETRKAIKDVYEQTDYILDPHGAVGYLGISEYLKGKGEAGIFLETAHPFKFKEVVEDEIDTELEPVTQVKDNDKKSIPCNTDFQSFKEFLMSA